MSADDDRIFRALADPTRRAILDALFERDGRSVGELAALFEDRLTRFAVMKHLAVLEEADLVVRLSQGRSRVLYLNPVPIEMIANRWISKYAARFTAALVDLHDTVAIAGSGGPAASPDLAGRVGPGPSSSGDLSASATKEGLS